MTELFDVLEVDIETRIVRLMTDCPKNSKNAEAIEMMALMRRGTDSNFFVTVKAGRFSDGDKYDTETSDA